MAWKKCMGSKRPAKDWILGQQRQGRRQRQQEVEGCRFVHWMMNWHLWGAYQRLILSKDVTRGWGQQSSTVERHLQREFWTTYWGLTSGNHGSFWWRLVVISTCERFDCNALIWFCLVKLTWCPKAPVGCPDTLCCACNSIRNDFWLPSNIR